MSEEREGFKKGTPEDVRKGKTDLMIGEEHGKVFIRYPQPVEVVVMEPANAFNIGEAIARAAHKAKFGVDAPTDKSYIAEQVRLRVTEDMRDRKIARVSIMVNNAMNKEKTPGYWAAQIVDTLLADIA